MTDADFGRMFEVAGSIALESGPTDPDLVVRGAMDSIDPYEQIATRYYQTFTQTLVGMPGTSADLLGNRDIKDGHQIVGRVLGLSVDAYLSSQPEATRSTTELENALLNYKTTGNVVDSLFASPSRLSQDNITRLGLTALDYLLLRNAHRTSITFQDQVFAFRPPMLERRGEDTTNNVWSHAGGYARPLWRAMVGTALQNPNILRGKPGLADEED